MALVSTIAWFRGVVAVNQREEVVRVDARGRQFDLSDLLLRRIVAIVFLRADYLDGSRTPPLVVDASMDRHGCEFAELDEFVGREQIVIASKVGRPHACPARDRRVTIQALDPC